jgi:STIMATE family
MIDNIVCLGANYLLLKLFERIAHTRGSKLLESGSYGDSDGTNGVFNFVWMVQTIVWNVIVIIGKVTVFYALVKPLKKPWYQMGDWMLSPLDPYPRLELIFVMIIVPSVLNVAQFWIQDQFLKRDFEENPEETPGPVTGDAHDADVSRRIANDDGGSDDYDDNAPLIRSRNHSDRSFV